MSGGQYDTLRTVSGTELLAGASAPREYLLSPWLRERQAVMLWAPTGAGKSQVAMSLALAVAGGREVLDWKAPRPRPVLFCDGEMDRDDLRERIVALAKATLPESDEGTFDNLHFLARDTYGPDVDFPDLGSDEGQAFVLAEAKKIAAALVVLDNLSTLATIEDENSAAAVKKPVELIQKLRRDGRATLLVHHSGKSGTTYRGSSNLATVMSWVIGLQPSPTAAQGTMDVVMNWHKTRDGAVAATVPRRLRLTPGEGGGSRWLVGADEDSQAARLAAAIRSLGYRNLEEAGAAIGLKRARAFDVQKVMFANELMSKPERDKCFEQAAEVLGEATGSSGEGDDGDESSPY